MVDSAAVRRDATRTAMPSEPVAIIDVLNSLLESQLNSVFRFMGQGSPYLSRAAADVRKPLADMVSANARHCAELAEMIQALGGQPLPRSLSPEEQYLAYLSLKFLLPKLVGSKELEIRRYENAIKAINPGAPPPVLALLRRQQAEHRAQLEILKKKSDEVIAASRS
jgi:hypothetical protein